MHFDGQGTAEGMARTKQTIRPSNGAIRAKQASADEKKHDNDVFVVKGRKRRWRSGTVALREIRRLSRSTCTIFPKAPFHRLVREITQDIRPTVDFRFSQKGMSALHDAAEQFVMEKFIKADIARRHAKRKTLHVNDVKFSEYMTNGVSKLVGNTVDR